MTETLTHGYSSESILSLSYLMNTNMVGFRWLSKIVCICVLWIKVALALEGLMISDRSLQVKSNFPASGILGIQKIR